MSAAHTPGPWCLGSSDRKVCDLAVCTEYPSPLEGATIARMVSKKGTEYHNAKLIAAAPDLLEFAMRVCYGESDGIRPLIAQGKAAIQKATGAA